MGDENPFAKQDLENPFADPSVSTAASSSTNAANPPGLEDYNPFDGNKTSGPAVMQADNGPSGPPPSNPPPYNASQAQQITSADFQRRQEELEKRARDLERREEELKNSPYNVRANNWPPLPSFIPIQPCFYQDINVDIPVEFQQIVRYLYYLWIWHVGFLFANVVVGIFYLFAGGDEGQTFGLSLVYLFVFTPASFLCWFRPAYKAFRNDSSFNFMVFFFVFFFQTLISVVYVLGIGNMGSCGLILSITMLKSGVGGKIFVGVLALITTLGFGVAAAADIYILLRIHKLYRTTGASMAKAQAEFTSGVMNNETVRQAAADAAAAGVRNTFQSATNGNAGNNAGGGNRY